VGAAARDVEPSDPRGWRLGGTVAYTTLGIARLGLRVAALVGVDPFARHARELDLLREAGVDVRVVPLEQGPVFENRETSVGRVQTCLSTSEHVPVDALPEAWLGAEALVYAPVAGELADAWSGALPGARLVALAWQGLLRHLVPGERTGAVPPRPTPLTERSDLLVIGRDDLRPGHPGESLEHLVSRPGQQVAVTAAHEGGVVLMRDEDGRLHARRYRAIPAGREVDATGAGDAFLAGWVAAELVLRQAWSRGRRAPDRPDPRAIRMAATVATLKLEAFGISGMPDREALRRRLAGAGASDEAAAT